MPLRITPVSMVTAVVLAMILSGCAERIDTPAEFVELALHHERESEYAEAAEAYRQAIELAPTSAPTWYDLGVATAAQDKLTEALAAYSKAIELDPNLERAFNNRAAVYARLKQFDKAIADCTQAIALNPADALAWRNRGLAFYDQGDFEKAAAVFDESIQIDGLNPETYLYRGNVYLELLDPVRALEDFDHALNLNADLGEAWLGRAKSLSALDRDEEAQTALAQSRQAGFESPEDVLSHWSVSAAPVAVVSASDTAAVDHAAASLKAEYRDLQAAAAPWDLMSTGGDAATGFVVRVADRNQCVHFAADELHQIRQRNDVSTTLVILKRDDEGNLEIAARYVAWNGDSADLRPTRWTLRPTRWTLRLPPDETSDAPMPETSAAVNAAR
jgi:tetratricopeptide (TPR) repeat protein